MARALVLSIVLVAGVSLSACATSATVREAPVTQGQSQDFPASYEVVTAAALEAVERLNVDVQGSDETAERFQIRFSKPTPAQPARTRPRSEHHTVSHRSSLRLYTG